MPVSWPDTLVFQAFGSLFGQLYVEQAIICSQGDKMWSTSIRCCYGCLGRVFSKREISYIANALISELSKYEVRNYIWLDLG